MSKFEEQNQIRLNVISKHDNDLRISIIVSINLTISQLKRKIQNEFHQLYGIQVLIKVIEDSNGFIISNNSVVGEHFGVNDTILFTQHKQKKGSNMNLTSNIQQIFMTLKYVSSSVLQKLDKIDLSNCNVLAVVSQILHLTFWYSNEEVVKKTFKIFNKIFGQETIQMYLDKCPEIQHTMLMRSLNLWLIQIQNTGKQRQHFDICWEIIQLLQKLTNNEKFVGMIRNHKIIKVIGEYSKDGMIPNEIKKTSMRIIKNVNGGGKLGLGAKVKSAYIPSMMGGSNAIGYDISDVLELLSSSSQDEKINAIQAMAQSNFELVYEATVRFQHYEKLTNIFTVRKLKNRKHNTLLNQIVTNMSSNTTKQKAIHIMQKDIIKKIHQFMLQTPTQSHTPALQYLKKIVRLTAGVGMFNIQKGGELINSPYPYFQKLMIEGIVTMSEKLTNVSSIRFIPGIKQEIKLCLKTTDQTISREILKLLSNLALDQQCRYQILNLKGIEIFVKFLQTNNNHDICRISAKGLLNLTLSSRETKVKVLSKFDKILDRFYEGVFDTVTNGFLQTILKSKNV